MSQVFWPTGMSEAMWWYIPHLSLLWRNEGSRFLSFVKMNAMRTLEPRLELPRDRQTTPPRRSKPFAITFFDGLPGDFFSMPSLEITPCAPFTVGAAQLSTTLFVVSNPGGTCIPKETSHTLNRE